MMPRRLTQEEIEARAEAFEEAIEHLHCVAGEPCEADVEKMGYILAAQQIKTVYDNWYREINKVTSRDD